MSKFEVVWVITVSGPRRTAAAKMSREAEFAVKGLLSQTLTILHLLYIVKIEPNNLLAVGFLILSSWKDSE